MKHKHHRRRYNRTSLLKPVLYLLLLGIFAVAIAVVVKQIELKQERKLEKEQAQKLEQLEQAKQVQEQLEQAKRIQEQLERLEQQKQEQKRKKEHSVTLR